MSKRDGDEWYDGYLDEVGWQKQDFSNKDQRRVHALGETKKLQKNRRGGYDSEDDDGDGLGSPGWTLEGARRSMLSPRHRVTHDEVERNMLDRQEVYSRAPEAYDAIALLHEEDPELLRQMEDDHKELDLRRRDRPETQSIAFSN